jgi:hypothetical protein
MMSEMGRLCADFPVCQLFGKSIKQGCSTAITVFIFDGNAQQIRFTVLWQLAMMLRVRFEIARVDLTVGEGIVERRIGEMD